MKGQKWLRCVIEKRRNVEKEIKSGNKTDEDCFWFHNRFIQVNCWATADILI